MNLGLLGDKLQCYLCAMQTTNAVSQRFIFSNQQRTKHFQVKESSNEENQRMSSCSNYDSLAREAG